MPYKIERGSSTSYKIPKRNEFEIALFTTRILNDEYKNDASIKIVASTKTKLVELVTITAEIFPLDFESNETHLDKCVVDLVNSTFTLFTASGNYETNTRKIALGLCLALDAPELYHAIMSLPEFMKELYEEITNDRMTQAQQLLAKLHNRKWASTNP